MAFVDELRAHNYGGRWRILRANASGAKSNLL
ncbi:hypothetical protein SNOG_13171 [Parastagonospora nodorum SN15]|uniref:Uncharacterized protein n=1 Tax=Phaeosphaeria nodorum (strain SN15 / ATCC MYA-4574 / FGSC 10173) TaxID=321614 RepID=Q0U4Z3_PHANO|nr:hypothetical protein SNOG_13171 [Parastagonospora nodorum SN15]EAT79498.1 hypothetical protein SNOG_13171 [Parastagonospora nodorum SN15]